MSREVVEAACSSMTNGPSLWAQLSCLPFRVRMSMDDFSGTYGLVQWSLSPLTEEGALFPENSFIPKGHPT